MTEHNERRTSERRHDPDAWSAAHRRQVRFVYALVVGGILVFAGIIVCIWAITNETVTNMVALLGGGMIVLGLVASMPRTFMPVLSAALKKIPWGKSPTNGDLTRTLEAIREEEAE